MLYNNIVAQQYCQEKIIAIHFYKIQGHQENIKELGRTILTRKNRGAVCKQQTEFGLSRESFTSR
jgi:hypothetical protein